MQSSPIILIASVALLLASLPARAQQVAAVPDRTDCNSPVGSIEQWICSSKHLRQLQDQIADGVSALVQASPMGQAIRSEQFTWNNNTYRKRPLGNVFLREALINRLREVRRITSLTEAALSQTHKADGIRTACVVAPPPTVDLEALKCEVVDAGPFEDAMFFQRQRWQPETGAGDGGFMLGATGILVFNRMPEKDGLFQLVAWDVEESSVAGLPELVVNPKAGSFLRLPIITSGSSGADLGVIFHRETPGQPWREVNASGWFGALTKKVPAGLIVRSSYLNLATLVASVTLIRDSDPSCCPTGGKGTVHLALRGDQLIIDDVDWAIPPATGSAARVRR